MYKIYIKETPLLIASQEEAASIEPSDTRLVARYSGKRKHLLSYVDMLEKSRQFDLVVLNHSDPEALWADFATHFKKVEAAGGWVRNPQGLTLFIYRRGFWDLPKGKIDEGEDQAEAAVREVIEETGLKDPQLGGFLQPTYHTYREKGKRILKITYWYAMTASQENLLPQAEEDIEEAAWMDARSFLDTRPPMHRNIRDLLEAGIHLK